MRTIKDFGFQHTAARRRLGLKSFSGSFPNPVSTHSRPKAAGPKIISADCFLFCFNTQPPEGGWPGICVIKIISIPVSTHSRPKAAGKVSVYSALQVSCFNTQPPEGGWQRWLYPRILLCTVSTHSRPKAAGMMSSDGITTNKVSTHSRPKAAGFDSF